MESSHATTHFKETPQLFELVREVIPLLSLDGEYLKIEHDMGRIVGEMDLVEIQEGEDIVYALRPLRDTYIPFVKHREPTPTSYISLHLRSVEHNEYDLHTAYVGRITPSIPEDATADMTSKEFWNTHALVWERQEIVPGTETTVCPW